jgi:hypothetical protein
VAFTCVPQRRMGRRVKGAEGFQPPIFRLGGTSALGLDIVPCGWLLANTGRVCSERQFYAERHPNSYGHRLEEQKPEADTTNFTQVIP